MVSPPVSVVSTPKFRILKIHRTETRRGVSALSARNARRSPPETGLFTANLRECRHFSGCLKQPARDPCGWLGIEDSNRDVSNSSPHGVASSKP
jgi:hypothetical protein